MERIEVDGQLVDVPDLVISEGANAVATYLAMTPADRQLFLQGREQHVREVELDRRRRREAGEEVVTVTIDQGD